PISLPHHWWKRDLIAAGEARSQIQRCLVGDLADRQKMGVHTVEYFPQSRKHTMPFAFVVLWPFRPPRMTYLFRVVVGEIVQVPPGEIKESRLSLHVRISTVSR